MTRFWNRSGMICFVLWAITIRFSAFVLFLNKHQGSKPTVCLRFLCHLMTPKGNAWRFPNTTRGVRKAYKIPSMGTTYCFNPTLTTVTTGNIYFLVSLYLRVLLVKEADRSAFLSERCPFTAQNFPKWSTWESITCQGSAVPRAAQPPHQPKGGRAASTLLPLYPFPPSPVVFSSSK